jgi:protein SCO1/2
MRHSRPAAVAFALALATTFASPSLSHSLKEVEEQLHDREKYFQAVDSQAPDFTLADPSGHVVGMSDLRGKVVVLHFIYTQCKDVCPLHAERIAEIQAMINQTPMKDMVRFVTITTDPKHDTGQVLSDYGAAHGLDPANWVFLTAAPGDPEDATRRLARAYGLEFTQTAEGEQMHGIVTHVIDQDGRLRARFHTLKFDRVTLVLFVNALTNKAQVPHEDAKPSLWNKLKGLFW